MPLKDWRTLYAEAERPKPTTEVTYVAPDTEIEMTLDRLAAFVRQHPDTPGFLCYEVERVSLGDGLVLITSRCFEPEAA